MGSTRAEYFDMGRLTFDVLDSWQEWDMGYYWGREFIYPDDYDDPPVDDDTIDPPVHPVRESVTDAQLQRRLAEALSLLKTLRRQEREQAR